MNVNRAIAVPFAIALGLAATPLAYSLDSAMLDDPLYEMLPPGEFVLGNGDDKTIAHAKTDKHYRICVGRGSKYDRKEQVPLKVMHDDLTTVVMPGDCADVEGKEIKVKPDGKLDEDYVLMGRFHKLKM